MSSVYYETTNPGTLAHQIHGNSGPHMVMEAWAGGAYDTLRNRLYVTGGGHLSYYGNEIYAFDIPTLKWLRITDPQPLLTYAGRSEEHTSELQSH